MSDPNNVPLPGQQQSNTQPTYQATPQYQAPQTPIYGQPAAQNTQQYAQPGNTYAQPGNAYTQPSNAYTQQTANPYTQQTNPAYTQQYAAAPAVVVPLNQPYYNCPFTEAFIRFWKKYATFSGRASRSEFWWWFLAAAGVDVVLRIFTAASSSLGFLSVLWWLATIVPTIALGVRRLHDTNKPGWWLAIFYGTGTVFTIALVIIVVVTMGGTISHYYYSYDYGYYYANANLDVSSILAMGGVSIAICALLILASWVVYIVFMALPSNPEGARFDAGAVATGYMPGAYTTAAGYAGYAQNTAYAAPTAPAAPGTSMPAATTTNYAQPAAAPVMPTAPAQEYGQPEQPAADNNVQQPWQGQQ